MAHLSVNALHFLLGKPLPGPLSLAANTRLGNKPVALSGGINCDHGELMANNLLCSPGGSLKRTYRNTMVLAIFGTLLVLFSLVVSGRAIYY